MSRFSNAPSAAVRELLRTLVGFDTTSHRSNLELIDYVYEYLSGFGVEPHVIYNEERSKANLYAVIGPNDRPGVALSGHTDVVPVEGQRWSHDPWVLHEDGGRLYGRGTCDMKGFIAVALAAVPRAVSAGLRTPLHLCLSYDEEVGCLGVRSLLQYLARQAHKPFACVVGEPTRMRVVTAHKGKLSVRCQVVGHACHSALAPMGVNAVETAAKVVTRLSEMAQRRRRQGPFDDAYEVPYTTIHTGVIHGGSTVNIVPNDCRFDFEFRHLPGDRPEPLLAEIQNFAHGELEPAMQAVAPEAGFEWEERARFPGLETPADSAVVALVKALAGRGDTGKVAFGSEGGLFQSIGIPSVVCGPGSIEQAHKPDEFIAEEELARCERFVDGLIDELAGEPARSSQRL